MYISNKRAAHMRDIILLDVVMPGVSGYQLCRSLRRDPRYALLPIIMVTSKDQQSDKFWAEQQGADGYVVKPFTAEQLLGAIQRLV